MEPHVLHSLAQSGDADVRTIALQRLMRKRALNDEEKSLLREQIPSLRLDLLLELLARHGDLDCPARIVDRLIGELPRDGDSQSYDAFCVPIMGVLSSSLDADAYADFVEKVRSLVSERVAVELIARVRGCSLYNVLNKVDCCGLEGDESRSHWRYWIMLEPLAASLFGFRYDERGCRAHLEAQV
ncbi:MAG: hypothetical protein L6Q76_27250, partial [Polyangiaceae bacterium]|nr:hypothetical protein [Polyangiaceae bacterium]